ncbi:N-acetyltransferase 10 [Thelohanellus kitauei]|uniref:RNA cytidine acetyltransferase n=1 Tax=Thelohanellus kitauei TaxID=669202 RepID=A0A0C2MIL7_THEKT|nr:N-acetyltransferase 10 [Thelohanellus kitauei]
MGFKKIDSRIRVLIENGVTNLHRSLFIIVGENAQEQVATIYNILTKSQIKARPTVLWCYKNELNFSCNREKRLKKLKRKLSHGVCEDTQNMFDSFICSSKIRFTFYKDSKKILGNTFGMLVLQDFEALTPNIMARTIETVEGGGVVCIVLSTIQSLRQLYTMTMDAHARHRISDDPHSTCRFNERFILSLNDCTNCLVLDDQLRVLPIFSNNLTIEPSPKRCHDSLTANEIELKKLVHSFSDIQPVGTLVALCKTYCQAKVLCKSFEQVSKPDSRSVIAITASRGRGKSATLGLIISGAISLGTSNIYVVAPSPENLITFFEFVITGLQKLGYNEKTDYEIQKSSHDNQKLITSIKITKSHRQNVQYLDPNSYESAYNAELIVCDEAAAIPLPLVKKLVGPHILFISSTVNGYEGTGRSLSLKLIKELREGSFSSRKLPIATRHPLSEFSLIESIRYAEGDPVEAWLNRLLCMDELNVPKIEAQTLSSPVDCCLYYVNRDTLFSYHKAAENFLQKLTSLFVSSHYKNSPNDLQMMADAPSHHVFVLLPSHSAKIVPDILCAIQISFEGGISEDTLRDYLGRGERGVGNLIPWIISQQFCEENFGRLRGVRVVRIATHPDYMSMGYGTRAMELLISYFNTQPSAEITSNEIHTPNLDVNDTNKEGSVENSGKNNSDTLSSDEMVPRVKLPPLLEKISDRKAEYVDYIGVSYGIAPRLLKFWKRIGFIPLYIRQTPNELTGEHSAIMIKLMDSRDPDGNTWVVNYYNDFRSRFLSLLSYCFKSLSPSLALSLTYHDLVRVEYKEIHATELNYLFSSHDLKRLTNYTNNTIDLFLITDLIPKIAFLWLTHRIKDTQVNWTQLAVILALGLQHRSLASIEKEMDLPQNQILSMINKILKKTVACFDSVKEKGFEELEKYQENDIEEEEKHVEDPWAEALKDNRNIKSISIPK